MLKQVTQRVTSITLGVLAATSSFTAAAQSSSEAANTSLANSLVTGIVETVVFSLIGIVMAVIGFKVVDWLTPGDLAEEVAHKENRALAILAGSMMLGVCIIIASALID